MEGTKENLPVLPKFGEEGEGQMVPAFARVAEHHGICPHLMWSQVVEQLTGTAALAWLVQSCK